MMLSRMVVLAALLLGGLGCASSTLVTPTDATDDSDGAVDPDAHHVDAPAVDAPAIDAPAIDAPAIDAAAIDAAMVDARSIDAAMVDARPIDAAIDARLIDAAIDAGTCPTAPCDLYAQCGCTGTQVCDIDFATLTGNACRSVSTAGTEGSTCTVPASCGGGLLCIGGKCERYCDADADCTQPRGQCVNQIVNNGTTPPTNLATTCSPSCDPVASGTSCGAGQKCAIYYADTPPVGTPRNFVDCGQAGTGAQGAACVTAGQPDDALCAADFMCTRVGATDTGHCRHACNRANGHADCAGTGAATCIGFATPLLVGGIEYGACN